MRSIGLGNAQNHRLKLITSIVLLKIYIMKASRYLFTFAAAIIILSCRSTKITSSWKLGNAETKSYHNIMVWAILPEKDSTLRRQVETHLVNDLIGKGYHALGSLEVYRAKAYEKLNSKEIVDEFKSTGVDAVITMVLLDKIKEEKYYPGGIFNPAINPNGRFDRYYSSVYEKILTPGYYLSTTDYFWEANLFDVSEDKMTYSVHTKSFDPASTESLAHENGLLILKDMVKQKIIKNPEPLIEQ